MNTTFTTLADGRELVNCSEGQTVVRNDIDLRELPELQAFTEMRYDPIIDEWVLVASARHKWTFTPPGSQSPLCPTPADNSTDINAADRDIVVFENRSPSLILDGFCLNPSESVASELVQRRPARGRCDAVVFTSTTIGPSPSSVRTASIAL